MKKKFLSILAAFAVLVSFSACQSQQSTELIDSVTTVVEEAAEPVEMKTIEPPEDGWTLEELLNVTYAYGNKVTNSCNINNFSENNFIFAEQYEDDKIAGGVFKYNDISVLTVIFDTYVIDKKSCSNAEIKQLYFSSNEYNQNNIFINGVTFGFNKEQVIENIGEPDEEEDTYFIYYNKLTKKEMLILNFDNSQKIIGIHLFF